MKNDKKGILMIMSNANGWRNPSVLGGAEIKTMTIISKMNEIEWQIILPEQLHKGLIKRFSASQLHYLPIKTLFLKTNIIQDLIQGLFYTWKCTMIGWKNKNNFDLIYSATTNFSDIFPAKIISLITKKSYVTKYCISIYDESKILNIYRNFRKEKNTIADSFIRASLARVTIMFLKQAKNVFVVCKYLGMQLEKCGVNKDKIKLNYNGVDFDLMGKFKDKNNEKKYDICCIGRIERNKGLQDIVDVVEDLKIKKSDISAIIIGDGSFLNDLKREIKKRGLENNIAITGFLGNERYVFLQQSRIFISPTYAKEGFGLTLLEALFFNVPIIAYLNPVFEEVFGRYESVRLINQDRKILQDNILDLLEDNPSHSFDIDIYSLNNCVAREREILSEIM
jgi:glycosyltransferase involved in cell wall biosynthesis